MSAFHVCTINRSLLFAAGGGISQVITENALRVTGSNLAAADVFDVTRAAEVGGAIRLPSRGYACAIQINEERELGIARRDGSIQIRIAVVVAHRRGRRYRCWPRSLRWLRRR